MNHLGALRLDQAAHDIDRGIVPVEQARGGNEAQRRTFGRWFADDMLGGRAHTGS